MFVLMTTGIKIAICTSDSREGTAEFLSALSLSGLVDMVLCGDDAASIAKPDPHNALHICAQLGVAPARAVMVGDTPADTIMGQAAHLGLTVGVLTGQNIYLNIQQSIYSRFTAPCRCGQQRRPERRGRDRGERGRSGGARHGPGGGQGGSSQHHLQGAR